MMFTILFFSLAIFVPDQHRINTRHMGIDEILILAATVGVLRDLYPFLYGWA